MSDTLNTATIEQEVGIVVTAAPTLPVIATPVQANQVSEYLSKVAEVRKKIAAFFRPNIDSAHALHKSLLAQMKTVDDKPAQIEAKCKTLLNAWSQEQERLRRAEQERLDREAREKAMAEARKAEEAAREAAAKAKAEGDKAAAAEAARQAAAAAKEAKAIESGKIPVVSTMTAVAPKVDGVTPVDVWHAECADMKALMKAVISGVAPASMVSFNQSEADKMARATKGTMAIAGIRWIKETTTRRTR